MHTWKVPFITSLTHGFHSTSSQIPGLDQHVVGRSLAVWPSVSKSCDAAINQLRKVILQLIIAQAIPGWIQWSCLRWDVLKCYHFKNSCTKKDHRFLVIFKLFWLFHPLGKSGKSFWQIVKPNHPMCLKIGTAKLLCEAPRFEILDEDIATLQQVFYNILSWWIHVKSISTAQTPKYSGRKSLEDSKSAILFYYLYKIQSIKQLWSLHRSMSEAESDGPSLVLKSTATLYLFRLQLEKYAATSESSKRGEGNSQKVYSFNPKLFYHLGNGIIMNNQCAFSCGFLSYLATLKFHAPL